MSSYGTKFTYCNCGNALNSPGDPMCIECDIASTARIEETKAHIALLNERECFRVMGALVTRIAAVRGDQSLKRSGYVKN